LRRLEIADEHWPLASAFVIARGAKTEAHVVVATIRDRAATGRGEAVPYARYGESVAGVLDQIEGVRAAIEGGADRQALSDLLPPGAARNALDCALWDLRAKQSGAPVWRLAGLAAPGPVETAFTLSLGPPDAMGAAARAAADRPLLKLKIGGADDLSCVEAVRRAAPRPRLILDANEGLDFETLRRLSPDFVRLGVALIEQPLKAGEDAALEGYDSPLLLCADESIHTLAELPACARRYGAVNIKLDKTGGLTEALALKRASEALGLKVMAGCMVATSLAMAPALLIAQGAAVADLDGPLLLSRDRRPGLTIAGSIIAPAEPALWG
jgi:L-alanine-DL-glutamate epimerase-like enolase superfamily enzyme